MEQSTGLKNVLPTGRNQWLVYISCLLVFAGFSCSRIIISLGVIGLIVSGLLVSNVQQTFAVYIRSRAYYINIIFFLVILLSGINSANKIQWLAFLQIKIPFILLPLAFCGFNFFTKQFFTKILLLFTACMCVSAAAVMVNYAWHYNEINLHILMGGVIPVKFSHIRYTLLLVFAFFCLLWLYEERTVKPRIIFLVAALFLFVVVHILSSRSGWLALYTGLLFYFAVYIYRSKKILLGLLMVATMVSMPFVFYRLIPSFHNKIDYMQYTLAQYKQGQIDDMGDAMRLASWITGIEMIHRHPYTGVGAGSMLEESKRVSQQLFPSIKNDEDRKMPHNEFIWIWAASGVFGLIAYCTAFFYPFLASVRYKNWLFAILFIIFFTSFLTEYPLEEQVGSTFYLLFLLIFLTYFNYSRAAHD